MSDVSSFWMHLLKPEDVDFYVGYKKVEEHTEVEAARYNTFFNGPGHVWGISRNWWLEATIEQLIDEGRLDDSLRFLSGERRTVEQITGPDPDYAWTGRHRLARRGEKGECGYHRQYTILPPVEVVKVQRELEKLWDYACTQTGPYQLLWLDNPETRLADLEHFERSEDYCICEEEDCEGEGFFPVLYNFRQMFADAVREQLTLVYMLDRFVHVVELE
jgi:hypothetical protein